MYRRSSWPDIGDEHGCLGTLSPPVTATRSLTETLVSSEWLEVATWVNIRLDERYASGIIFSLPMKSGLSLSCLSKRGSRGITEHHWAKR